MIVTWNGNYLGREGEAESLSPTTKLHVSADLSTSMFNSWSRYLGYPACWKAVWVSHLGELARSLEEPCLLFRSTRTDP